MPLFAKTYSRVMQWSRHPGAAYYLSVLSFVESFILPFPPPDVLLAPMSMANPRRAMHYAGLTLLFSILGGLIGYLIGAFLFTQAQPYIEHWGYQQAFDTVTIWFQQWGFWAVLVAGFSPLPYKVFTVAAGVLHLALLPFLLASIVGRGARFFLVAWCLAHFGPGIELKLMRHIEVIGWATVGILVSLVLYYYLGSG